jgi:hypothetical protein
MLIVELLKGKTPIKSLVVKILEKLGFVFVCVAVLLAVAVGVLVNKLPEKYETYPYETISSQGRALKAHIFHMNAVKNKRINRQVPQLITYQYNDSGTLYTDQFPTIDIQQLATLQTKDSIDILVLNHQSVIKGLHPAYINYKVFWMLPLFFFIIGCCLMLTVWLVKKAGSKYATPA